MVGQTNDVLLFPVAVPINRQVGLSSNVYMERRNDSMGNQQNVCMIDDVMYYDGDTIPTSSPCEHCVCRPPGFACDSLICEKRPGCRSVQRSNQCCAEYKCECEVNGRVYQNGERLEDPQSPCEVCYCQGGEMVCTVIECYKRKDCEAIKVPGVCCPKYDNCPPLDEATDNETTSSEEQSQDEYSTVSNIPTQQSASGEDAGNQTTSSEERNQETAESTSQQSFLKQATGNETPSSDGLSQEVDNSTEDLQSNKQEDHTASDMKTTLLGVVDIETSTISNHLYETNHTEEESTTFGDLEDLLNEPTITENLTEIKDTTLSNNIKDVPQEHKDQFYDFIKTDRPVQINQTFAFIKEETTSIDLGGMSTYSVTYTEYVPQDSSEKESNVKGTFYDQPAPITASQVKSSPTLSSYLERTILTLKEEVQNDQFQPTGDEAVTSHQSFSTMNTETGTEQLSSTTSVTLKDKHQYPSRNILEELEQDFYSGSGSGAPGSGMSSLEDQWSIPATSTEIHDSSDLSDTGNNTGSTTGHDYTSLDNSHEHTGETTTSTDLHNGTEDGLERFETAGPTSSSHTTISVGYGNTQFTTDSILAVIHSNNSLSSVTSLPNDEEGFQNDQVYSVGDESVTTRQSSLILNSDKTTETGTEQVSSTIYPTTSVTREDIHQYPSRNNILEELEQDFYSGSGSGAPGSGMSSLEDQWSIPATSTESNDSSDSSDTGNNTGSTTEHDYTSSDNSHEHTGETTTSTELHSETEDGLERFLTTVPTSSSDAMTSMGSGDTHFTPKSILDIIHSSNSLSSVTSLPNDQSTAMDTKETTNTRSSQGHETSNYESESSTHVTYSMGDVSSSSVVSQNNKQSANLIKSPSVESVETFSNSANDYLENMSQTDVPEIYETSSQIGDYTTESLVSTLLIEISTEGHEVLSNGHEILSKILDGITDKLLDQTTQASLNQDTTFDSTLYPTEIPSATTVKSETILEDMQNDQAPVPLESGTNESSSDFEGTVNNGTTLQSEEGLTSTEMVNVENNMEMGTKILPDIIELKSNKSGGLSMPENIIDNQTGSKKANETLPQEWLKKGDINYMVHSGDYSATDTTTTEVVLGEDMDNVATKNETLLTIKETNESQHYESTHTTTINEDVSTEQTSFSQTTEDTTYSTIIAENGSIATVVSEQEEEAVIIKNSVGNHDSNLVEESFSKIQEEGILALSNSSSQEHNLFNIESNVSSTSTESEMTTKTKEGGDGDQTFNKINTSNITESAHSQETMSERPNTDSEKVKAGLTAGIHREHKIEEDDLRLVQNFVSKLSYHQDYKDTPV
uniref:VWFC domain-containing protein n=1 Tax=Timema monikensis TaxID=170555 RepID=A0A7R9EGG5_9NEOP|nr:unnamed protein product [Timema monikensis]